ncbi:hypothetical protein NONI108955_01225 [Nocardia ninae]|uniref:Uncharacterized protein n=1 Tax=Nocardia ninae NBRC 108245 TaxID=1210091 RepID=A0A511MC42_9NOCA|nr:hypothetical protein [Nocardia ninae]GEM38200.1 hypothetical protein NN4_27190 [Nocardia ninae NBRC 108245]
MPKPKIHWEPNGQYNLRRAPGVVRDGEARGRRVKAAAGEGFEMTSRQGARHPQGRWRVTIFARTIKAARRNAKDNTLVKALNAGRGR